MNKDTIFVEQLKKTESRGLDHTRFSLANTPTQNVLHGGFYHEPLVTLRKMPTFEIYLAYQIEHSSIDVLFNFLDKDKRPFFTYPNFLSTIFIG